jgi:glycosyltransferase involved in cell wall biosynthesis
MLVDLVNGLDASRFRHTIIRGVPVSSEGDYLEHHPVNCDVITLPELRRSLGILTEFRTLIRLIGLLRQLQPDIVHTHMAKAGVVGRLAALLARRRIRVHTFHGHLLHGYFSPIVGSVFITIERVFRNITSYALVVGSATRQDLITARIVTESDSTVVLPGMKPIIRKDPQTTRSALGLPMDRVCVGFVGRFTEIKRPDRFLALAALLPDAHFVMFGNGPLHDEIIRRVTPLTNVSIFDFTTDLAEVFAATDIVVLTSDNEGVPLSLMEAAAAGLPVVSLRVGGVAEIVDHEVSGLLANSDCQLHDAVLRLVQDESLRASLGGEAQRLIHERCALSDYLLIHERLYTQLLAR